MINDLTYFDNSIVGRYRTVERNIKSKSNSFYDSFLDLLENTIKRILVLEEVPYDEKFTCGTLLRDDRIIAFFKEEVGVDDYTYTKCKDYIAKVNRHKHFNEHMINIDTVVTYIKVYHNLVSDYLHFKDKECSEFSADYFNSIYGITEKENKELKNEVCRLKDDIESLSLENKLSTEDNAIYKALISSQEMENLSLEEQNTELRNQLSKLKDIKINAIEVKLNKALELLYNLTDSVVESRAIGIAVGKSITGQDITQTDYMKDAVEIVKNKETVFEKLDRQGKDLSDLSSKFSDMDVESLYAAAEKAFKEKNSNAALKYYEQLCLLKPNDWKPPFYVGVCKSFGTWERDYYYTSLIYTQRSIVTSALSSILKAETEKKQREKDVEEVGNIAIRNCEMYVRNYKETIYGNKYLKEFYKYIYDIQFNIAETVKAFEPFKDCDAYKEIINKIAESFCESIQLAGDKCDSEISEELFLTLIRDKRIKYHPVVYKKE